MPKEINITGKKFNRLTALKYICKSKNGHHKWLFKCDCGKEIITDKTSVACGRIKSCGCLAKEIWSKNLTRLLTKHNLSKTGLYDLYYSIKKRCYNKNSCNYKTYGGRGIKMCDEWEKNFLSFYNWSIENGYKKGLTIDRIDVNGNYEPSNCRWATKKEQANNRRNTVLVKINDSFLPMSEAVKLLKRSTCYIYKHYETKYNRIALMGKQR